MPRVIHFEIHAENPERAAAFYRDVLGWKIEKWDGPIEYWLVYTGEKDQPGIDGGLMRRQGPGPTAGQAVNAYVCTVDVPSVDEFERKVAAKGGRTVLPKMPIPGMGWLIYCTDTEGNIFGMMQNDPTAK